MFNQEKLKRIEELMEEDFKYYFEIRLNEAKVFKQISIQKALTEFKKGKNIIDTLPINNPLNRKFLLKMKYKKEIGEENFWKYLMIRLKETEEDNDLRNFLILLTNCKPDIRKLYKEINQEEKGNEIYHTFNSALKRLGLYGQKLFKVSEFFENVNMEDLKYERIGENKKSRN